MKMNLELSEKIIEAVKKKAVEMKIPVCIAVVNKGGNLVAFERMDGAMLAGIGISIDKAYTAAATTFPTGELGKLAQPGQSAYGLANSNQGRIIVYAGGLPIKSGDKLIGGIGVSGGLAPDDEKIAQGGLSVVK